jgi:hypothetical protein
VRQLPSRKTDGKIATIPVRDKDAIGIQRLLHRDVLIDVWFHGSPELFQAQQPAAEHIAAMTSCPSAVGWIWHLVIDLAQRVDTLFRPWRSDLFEEEKRILSVRFIAQGCCPFQFHGATPPAVQLFLPIGCRNPEIFLAAA